MTSSLTELTALPSIAAAVAVLDVAGAQPVFGAANERYLEVVGLESLARVVGRGPSDVVPGYAVTDFLEHLDACVRSREAVEFDSACDRGVATTWWRNTMLPTIDGDGVVSRVFLTAIDITDKKRVESAYRESRERLRAIVENAYDAIITVDHASRVKFMNGAALRMFGYKPEEILGERLDALLPESVRERHEQYLEAFRRSPIAGREMHERSRVVARRRTGEEFSAQVSISKVHLESGVEMTAILRDVTETTRLIAELNATATVDELTKLATRRRFIGALADELERFKRYGRPLSLAIFDVDFFKRINDEHGHPAGDAVLRELGRVLSGSARTTDLAARLGGEELAILFPETTLAEAETAAERVRKLVEAMDVRARNGDSIRVTVSAGVATIAPGRNEDELIAAADEALYEAKRAGRNRVVAAESPRQAA